MKLTEPYGIPRRCRIDLLTPIENQLRNAILSVEDMGCHTSLTEIVVLLDKAKDKMADYLESENLV